jgi:hypothetical protein
MQIQSARKELGERNLFVRIAPCRDAINRVSTKKYNIKNKIMSTRLLIIGLLISGLPLQAKVVLPTVLGDNMVLQQQSAVKFVTSNDAGEDRVFVPANAVEKGGKIVVSSEKIEKPVAVRYLYKNYAEASVFNIYGIPASPFRTDNW